MTTHQGEIFTSFVVREVMKSVEDEVDKRQLLRQMPLFLTGEVGKLIG